MRNVSYYVFVVLTLASTSYMVLSLADAAIKRQDVICQEGC
jgi:hypothetical protein